MTARMVESQSWSYKPVGARTKLSCEQAPAPWDFVCSFEPTPQTSTTRVKFGVRVTSRGGIFEFSALTPAVVDLPAPVKGHGG